MKLWNTIKKQFKELKFNAPNKYLIKTLVIVVLLSIFLDLIRGAIYQGFKSYIIITMAFYFGSLLAYWTKRTENAVTPWKALAWPLGVFNNNIRRWMFE